MAMAYQLIIFDWNGTLAHDMVNDAGMNAGSLIEGVPELLAQLHQDHILIAIATMAPQQILKTKLQAHRIEQYVDAYSCGDDAFVKPHPSVIESILEKTGIEPNKALMVGDSESDIKCAHYAHVDMLKIGEAKPGEQVIGVLPIVTDLYQYLYRECERECE